MDYSIERADPRLEPIQQEARALVSEARRAVVQDEATHAHACERLKAIRSLSERIEAHFAPAKIAAHNAHKAVLRACNDLLAGPEQARQLWNDKIVVWRREEQARRETEARECAARLRAIEEEARLAEAIRLEEAGEQQAAAAVLEAEPAPVAVIAAAVEKHETKVRRAWTFRIIDANAIPRKFLIPDEKAIGALVRTLKDQHGIAGIEAYYTETLY